MWALLVLAPSCVLLLIAQPRPIATTQMPFLDLDPVEVRRVLQADRELSSRIAPSPLDDALQELLKQDALLQLEVAEAELSFEKRRRGLSLKLGELVRGQGPEAGLAARTRAVQHVEDAMSGHLAEDAIPGVMGAFANQLERHGLLHAGRVTGSDFVVRSFYKARWNTTFGLPMDHGLAPIERQAVHGWLGLRSNALSVDKRLLALKRYHEVGGRHALEAQGILLTRARDFDVAITALTEAQETEDGGLRVANHLLGAQVSAEFMPAGG